MLITEAAVGCQKDYKHQLRWLLTSQQADISIPLYWYYRKVTNIRRTLVSNKIVDHSDVVGASAVRAAPITSSFAPGFTWFHWIGQRQLHDETKKFKFGDLVQLILEIMRYYCFPNQSLNKMTALSQTTFSMSNWQLVSIGWGNSWLWNRWQAVHKPIVTTLIARFMGPTGPRLAPCWPHELCYLGKFVQI